MATLGEQFQVGQKVSLKDTETGYRLVGLNGDEPGLEVVAIHADYIGEQSARVSGTIPLYEPTPASLSRPKIPVRWRRTIMRKSR